MTTSTRVVSAGAFAEIFRPHSHDAADSIDNALEASERGIHAVKVSFVALMLTALVQLAIVVLTEFRGAARGHDPQLLRRAHGGAAVPGVSIEPPSVEP